MKSGQIDLLRLREIVYALDPCIEIEVINIRVFSSNGLYKVVYILAVVDVVYKPVSSAAVLPDKLVDLSCLRPIATTLEPSWMSFSAIPRLMPEVAPTTRTHI